MDTHRAEKWANGPVVVGTDGSTEAASAVRWAAQEAAARDQPLRIVHAVEVDEADAREQARDTAQAMHDAAHRILNEAVELAHDRVPDLRVSTEVSTERAWEGLMHAADEATTIVVGPRGLGGFPALLLGSVGLKVASHAKGPVVVVRGQEERTARRVVAGVRNEADLDAVRFAARIARRSDASLRLVSAWTLLHYLESMAPLPDKMWAAEAASVSASERIKDSVREEFPDIMVNADVVQVSSPAGALVDASAEADLLVVGARNPSHPFSAPLGHVAHAVLQHAQCPVAVLPHGRLH